MSFSYPFHQYRNPNYKPRRETVKIRKTVGGLHNVNYNDIVHVDYVHATLLFGTALPDYFVQTSFGGIDLPVLEDIMKMHVKRIEDGFIPHPLLKLPYPPFVPFHKFGDDEVDDYPNDDEMAIVPEHYGKDYIPESDNEDRAGNNNILLNKASWDRAMNAKKAKKANEATNEAAVQNKKNEVATYESAVEEKMPAVVEEDKKMPAVAVVKEEVEWPNQDDCYIIGSRMPEAALIKTEDTVKKEDDSLDTQDKSTCDTEEKSTVKKRNRSAEANDEVVIYHPEVVYMDPDEARKEHELELAKKKEKTNNILQKRSRPGHRGGTPNRG